MLQKSHYIYEAYFSSFNNFNRFIKCKNKIKKQLEAPIDNAQTLTLNMPKAFL